MSPVRRSMLISLAERYLSTALSLVSVVIVARLLSPTDIGLFSIASALVGLAQVVRDVGIGSYLVQEPELTPARVNTAYTITAGVGLTFFTAIWLCAGLVADFYADARMVELLRVMAASFLVIPIGSTSLALLRREMRFGGVFIVNTGATLVSFTVTVGLAFLGHGYMSLAWGVLASNVATALLAWYQRPNDKPLRLGLRDWRRVLGYGSRLTLAGIVTEVAMNINDLVTGRVLGPAAVAIVSRAQGVMNLMHINMLGAVNSVMLSAFSRTRRSEGRVDLEYERSRALISVVAWPFYGFLALFPLGVLRLMFGPQWDAAAPLVPLFALAGALAVLWKLTPVLLQALGRADLIMRAELLIQSVRIVMLSTIVIATHSLIGFAAGLVLAYGLAAVVFERQRRIALPLDAGQARDDGLWRSLKVTATALAPAAAMAALQWSGQLAAGSLVVLLLAAGTTVLSWLAALRLHDHPLWHDPLFARLRLRLVPRVRP